MKSLIYLTVFWFAAVGNINANNLQVQVQQGTLKGYERKSRGGKAFVAYQGIPYAQPPVGEKRFQLPEPAKSWDGVLDATEHCASCPQYDAFVNNFTVFGDEDCLCLNVYAPRVVNDDRLPVIVFIHGGGFMNGHGDSNLYGPDILLDHNLIAITINYRLGPLGFLSFEDEILPGNNGLKDQALALKWIKENVKQFGGNPSKITVYGNSAGGASAYYHLLSPLSKDLLHGAISSSGISTAPWAIAEKGAARTNALRLAKYLGCTSSSTTATLQCLRKVSAFDIVRANDKFMEFLYDPMIPHKPVIEPDLPGAFLTKHPFYIIRSGEFAQIPYMVGMAANDGAIKAAAVYNNNSLVERLNEEFDYVAPLTFVYDHHPASKSISKKIKEFYFQNRDIDNTTKAEVTNVYTDALLYYPQRLTSLLHSKYSSRPVYYYIFGYRGSVSSSTTFGDPEYNYGVCHGDDLLYTLSNNFFTNPTATDQEMSEIMSTLLYNFASTGNPTSDIGNIISTKWESLKDNDFKYLLIKDVSNITMGQQWSEERYKFWNKLDILKIHEVKEEL